APEPGALRQVAVGDWVQVATLGQRGEVIAVHGDEVEVRVGVLRTRARLEDLATARKPRPGGETPRERNKAKVSKARAGAEPAPDAGSGGLITREATCDLRGLRADEAQRLIVAFLDERYLADPPTVLFIHGHGTGALRQVVREALAAS